MAKNKGGRPPAIKPQVLQLLEEAFMWGYTDEQAAFHAEISPRTLYYYQKENKKFLQRKAVLKTDTDMGVKRLLHDQAPKDVKVAQWWAEKKMSDEFGGKIKIEHAGKVETSLDAQSREDVRALTRQYEEELFKRITAPKNNQIYGNQSSETASVG